MGSLPLSSTRGRPFGRYVMYDEIAAGGMATVYFGRLRGERGFSRTVAIKRLHPQYARDPEFVSMLVDEARIAARVKHPHVVPPLDVIVTEDEELLLVMEYVHGEVLARLLGLCVRLGQPVPPEIVVAILAGTLHGLHAAHEAVSDRGVPLHIVHRDISPPNILVGIDGVARVLDFGVAKAGMRASVTQQGATKGKLSYMSPEQLRGGEIDRRTDVFAAGVVLWETLTLRRLFPGDDPAQVSARVLRGPIPPPSTIDARAQPAFDGVVARALARPVEERFTSALEFATALEAVVAPASERQVGAWVARVAGERLARREAVLARVESADDAEPPVVEMPSLLDASHLARLSPPPLPPEAMPSVVVERLPRPASSAEANAVVLTPPPKVPVRRRRALAALSGISAAGLVAWALTSAVRGPRQSPQAVPTTAAAGPALPDPDPGPHLAPSAVEPPVPPAELTAGVGPAGAPALSTKEPAPLVPRRRPPRSKASVRGPDCDPPYLVDGRGIRRIKPGCLAR
jgi:serine/threonine-protein kinase